MDAVQFVKRAIFHKRLNNKQYFPNSIMQGYDLDF